MQRAVHVGYDALGFISCTGTNFLVRSNALREVGGSPTYTLTEDYALGMALKMYGWHCRYVQVRCKSLNEYSHRLDVTDARYPAEARVSESPCFLCQSNRAPACSLHTCLFAC